MERRRFLKNKKVGTDIINNKFYYTTSNGDIVMTFDDMFNARITLNYYNGNKGLIICDNTITNIGNNAFNACDILTSVLIPENVTNIGNNSFYNCSNLTSITCNSVTPPNIYSSDTFYGVDKNIPVYVPSESVNDYKNTSYWNEFTNIQSINLTQ